VVAYPDAYVQPLLMQALQALENTSINFISSLSGLQNATDPVLQFSGYESLDFEHAMQHPKSSLVCAYVIRKALIRKHYLSNTISTWLVKNQTSTLGNHFQACVHFELDYAEFLDDALVDAWDLNESMAKNDQAQSPREKQWWILKPGMSDGGNGIRLFSSIAQLQSIFEEWEEQEEVGSDDEIDQSQEENPDKAQEDEDTKEAQDEYDGNAMTSQLRHFIAQPYIDPPLLLDAYGKRKFHIRTYVLAVGALRVYVYKEMLALFAALPYQSPSHTADTEMLNLSQHLTNTCFQDESTKNLSVHAFWDLEFPETGPKSKEQIFKQICEVTGDVFEAAAREQMVHFQTLPNAFEIFGVDFLVDQDANVWLLELNAYPDFKQTGRDLQDTIVGGLFKDVVRVAVLPFLGLEVGETSSLPMVRQLDLGRG
jgi:tubulin--tyrosine ligase